MRRGGQPWEDRGWGYDTSVLFISMNTQHDAKLQEFSVVIGDYL